MTVFFVFRGFMESELNRALTRVLGPNPEAAATRGEPATDRFLLLPGLLALVGNARILARTHPEKKI